MTDKERENQNAFLEDYGKLCLQYGSHIDVMGEGDCDLCVVRNVRPHVTYDISTYLSYLAENIID